MKKTIYFKSQEEMLDYYGGNVSYIPSNTLAIVGDEDNFVLFSTSNNQSMNGSMEDQGGYIDNISGYAYVTTNGDHNVASYEMVNVNVPNVIPSGYVYVNGTYNISDNGTFDVSSYENAYVSVQTGGVEYTWIDWGTSPVLTQGDKVSFNGYLGSGEQITQEIINLYPAFADYLGWYLYPVGGWDRSTSGTTPWEKYVLSENQLSISQNSGVVVYGEIVDITMGSATQKITILEDINETKYAGGNGTMNIYTNGTQQVAGYQSVSVNVTPQRNHDGLTEITAFTVDEALDFINTLDPNTPTTNMYYVKGRISQVIYTIDSTYNTWRGYISNDGTTTTNELLVYGNGYGPEYQTVNWDENVNPQVKVGDSVVVYAKFQLYNNTPQTKNGYLSNHQRAVNGSPLNNITANGVVDVQDYVSVNVNIPDSEFNQSKLTDNPNSDLYSYLRITNTNTQNTIYYQLYPLDGNPICTTIVRLHDIIDYCFPNISYDNLIINLVYWNNTVYYNDTVGGALLQSNFVSPLLLQSGTSTDSFITDFAPDHLCIGMNLSTNEIYIWNGDSVFQDASSQ